MKNTAFYPEEIIFAATDACNLHCPHCFVSRSPNRLNLEDAKNLILSCKEASTEKGSISRIGFSGGEPFLYLDFLLGLIPFVIQNDLYFDQIMTNGDWWKSEQDLKETLQKIYDAGYDGKIGLSYDLFHGQKSDRIRTFISTVMELFGEDSINIQTVVNPENSDFCDLSALEKEFPTLKIYRLEQTFPSSNPRAWNSKKWFKEDYCQGPGHILYVHANGNIAPCCGFANENPELFIGNIKDSFETILKKAEENPMVKICYEKGLSKQVKILKKQLKKEGQKLPGKTSDICTFCDYVCKKNVW